MSIAGVGDSLAARLVETGQRTADDMLARVEDIDGRVKAVGDTLVAGIDARGDDLVGAHQRVADVHRRARSPRMATV